MKFSIILALLSLVYLTQAASITKKLPFSNLKRYSVSGILSLPYAEIAEPFRVWYDEEQFASRIDYYDGMVSTIQLAPSSSSDLGVGIKVAPLTTEEVTNAKTCFWLNGTAGNPVTLQSVIPDFSTFTVRIATKKL